MTIGGTMKLNNLFLYELINMQDCEQQLLKALPKICEKAASDRLANMLKQYLSDIGEHILRNELMFKTLDAPLENKKSVCMEALLLEVRDLINEFTHTHQQDAALIMAIQKISEYKIVGYGCLLVWSKLLGLNTVTDLIDQNLLEEKDLNTILTNLAENQINSEAFLPVSSV
jgi:ferritin-like metal-binding protein YciE